MGREASMYTFVFWLGSDGPVGAWVCTSSPSVYGMPVTAPLRCVARPNSGDGL